MAYTNDMNTPTKVPCGGFVLGEGLALGEDGKTLNVTGGGGSQADWNQNDESAVDYVKNRPFYDNSKETILMEESTLSFTYVAQGMYTATLPETVVFVEGKTYIICYDGVTYTCVAYLYNNKVSVGDRNMAAGEMGSSIDSFCIQFINNVWTMAIRKTGDSHTLSIKSIDEDIKKIDEKYLPSVKELNFLSSTEGSSRKFKITVDDTGAIKATEVTI